jgi:putative cell wall-binding protein
MPARKKSAKSEKPAKSAKSAAKHDPRRWSAEVMQHSNALDLEPGVFTWKDPRRIAASLKRSAEMSTRRKAAPYRSALSMLTFHINRGGTNLPAAQKKVLERAKVELRRQFGRE